MVNRKHVKVGVKSGFSWKAGQFSWGPDRVKPLVMGILNVTPDSFSDGGRFRDLPGVLAVAEGFVAAGASILDVGGESTRPGSRAVSVSEEIDRVLPVVGALSEAFPDIAVSIDSRKAEVVCLALEAGASIVNDVGGMRCPRMIEVCGKSDCGIVVMHMQGNPETMQDCPTYRSVCDEVRDFFEAGVERLELGGIVAERVVLDPGIGFGKSLAHNLELIKGGESLRVGGRPLMMGLSRKSLIGQLLEDDRMELREFPTLALSAYAMGRGSFIHRVHSVRACADVLEVCGAVWSEVR